MVWMMSEQEVGEWRRDVPVDWHSRTLVAREPNVGFTSASRGVSAVLGSS